MSEFVEQPGEDKQWVTPIYALKPVYEFGTIGLDPCSNDKSLVLCNEAWTIDRKIVYIQNRQEQTVKTAADTFLWSWGGRGLVYANPPYGDESEPFLKKFAEEGKLGTEIISLLPCRTDTKRWHKYAGQADAICLRKGRIKFINYQTGKAEGSPLFPSAFLYYGKQTERFKQVFSKVGMVLKPS